MTPERRRIAILVGCIISVLGGLTLILMATTGIV
jgi:hypothetical protein